MTEKYIEYKLKDTSDEARDFLAWNSIRAEDRLLNSPHLWLQREQDKKTTEEFLKLHNAYMDFRNKQIMSS